MSKLMSASRETGSPMLMVPLVMMSGTRVTAGVVALFTLLLVFTAFEEVLTLTVTGLLELVPFVMYTVLLLLRPNVIIAKY
jgi:hypothetical protein